jgi:branched-chain amino acid transport system ATP-binding protein
MSAARLLQVDAIETYYDSSQALFGVDFDVGEGECVSLLGRNGMGKSTTVKSVMGLLSPRRGTIRFRGTEIQRHPSYRIARQGISIVPEGREIFPTLTVRENLVATAVRRPAGGGDWTLETIFRMFPRLAVRQGALACMLSGGEQQMLAIGRALMTNPTLLILDEATEGLAPLVRREIWSCLGRLKAAGLSLIVIDKNLGPLLELADRHNILERGRVVWRGTSAELRAAREALQPYLGI